MPDAGTVRLYDGYTYDVGGSGAYEGRWVVTVEAWTPDPGSDGTCSEFDFEVPVPGGGGEFFGFWIGNTTGSPADLTAGFTFDSAAPPAWADSFGNIHVAADGTTDGSWSWDPESHDQVNQWTFDGTDWTLYPLDWPVTLDPASDPNWYLTPAEAPPPPPVVPGWLMVGAAGGGMTSAASVDGVTWEQHSTPFDGGHGSKVVWNGSYFLAIGGNADHSITIITSPDGLTWTARANPLDDGFPFDVAWSPALGRWMVVGQDVGGDPLLMTSPDAATWTTHTQPLVGLEAVGWGDGLWLIGGNEGPEAPFLASSPDGVTWTLVPSAFDDAGGFANGIAFLNGVWVITGGEEPWLPAEDGPAQQLTNADALLVGSAPGDWVNDLGLSWSVSGGVLTMGLGTGHSAVVLTLDVNSADYAATYGDDVAFSIDVAADNSSRAFLRAVFRDSSGTALTSVTGSLFLLSGSPTSVVLSGGRAAPDTAYVSIEIHLSRSFGTWAPGVDAKFSDPVLHLVHHDWSGEHVVETSPDLVTWNAPTTPMDSVVRVSPEMNTASAATAEWSAAHGRWYVGAWLAPAAADKALISSDDLTTWRSENLGDGQDNVRALKAHGSRIVAGAPGNPTFGGTRHTYYSDDGGTWTIVNEPGPLVGPEWIEWRQRGTPRVKHLIRGDAPARVIKHGSRASAPARVVTYQ